MVAGDKFLGRPITPLTHRRLRNFQANKRGYWSLWIFLFLLVLALFAELIANDKDHGHYAIFVYDPNWVSLWL